MAAVANLVHQQSASTGTGDFTLAAVNGKQGFATAFGTGATTDVFDYFISNRGAAEWERGTGHMSDSTTLVRDTVIESTNSNAAVDFTAGTKDVMNDVPAAKQVTTDDLKGPTVQIFTSSGTWTKPAGCVKIKVTVIGPGGDGGDCDATTGTNKAVASGGSGGGWAIKYIDVSSIASATVTIGAHNGGTTSWADGTNTPSATSGGKGSQAGPSTGSGIGGSIPNPGVGSGGDINGTGSASDPGCLSTGLSIITGSGGGSLLGGGAPGRLTATQSSGAAATTPGAGGAGAGNSQSQATGATGGFGANGAVIVEEYYA